MTVSKTLRKGVISFEFDWKREIGTENGRDLSDIGVPSLNETMIKLVQVDN